MGIFDWLFRKKSTNSKTENSKIERGILNGKIMDDFSKTKRGLTSVLRDIHGARLTENGFGIYTFLLTGVTYEGMWKDGLKHGKGKEIDSSGNIINEGIWEKGHFIGDGYNDKNEELFQNGDTRIKFLHEIMTKGSFNFELNDGTEMSVFGQRHTLVEIEEHYDDGEWVEGDRDEIDDFYLTGYEEGSLFEENDICKFFEVDDYGDWDFNGFSNDWCGIKDEDDNETRQKKWNDYKSKFPRVTLKEQFEF